MGLKQGPKLDPAPTPTPTPTAESILAKLRDVLGGDSKTSDGVVSELQFVFEGEYERGYHEGYDDGKEDGKEINYRKGYDIGWKEGYTKVHREELRTELFTDNTQNVAVDHKAMRTLSLKEIVLQAVKAVPGSPEDISMRLHQEKELPAKKTKRVLRSLLRDGQLYRTQANQLYVKVAK